MFTLDLKRSYFAKLAVRLQELASDAVVFIKKVVLTTFSADYRVQTNIAAYFTLSTFLLGVKIIPH